LIHYSKKQGILPLWFIDELDYTRIGAGDTIETMGLEGIFNGTGGFRVRLKVTKLTGESFELDTKHTLSPDQLKWLHAGSALNHIRALHRVSPK
jgi:homoaconitase